MQVAVVCFGRMRDYLTEPASGRAIVDVPEDGTVRDAIEALGAPVELIHSVLLDGTRVDLDRQVPAGAEVTLMPPFAGGS